MARILIDLDIILYKGLSRRLFQEQRKAAEHKLEGVMDRFPNDEHILILSGTSNFRKLLYPQYKANRGPKPENHYDIKKYFIKYWEAEVAEGEADDMIGMLHGPDSIIASTDKDMKQLGGTIYNFDKDTLEWVDDPNLYFWIQMLCGDSVDNVPGVRNPAKAHHAQPPNFTWNTAESLLKDKTNRRQIVEEQYQAQFGQHWSKHFDLHARLLFIWRPGVAFYNNCKALEQ